MIKREVLAGLATFRTVVRLGSFARAGDYLGISASAVSQSVRALEARLGVRLLNRTSRSVAPSEAGRAFLAHIDEPLDRIEAGIQHLEANRGEPSGTLRINLSRLAADLLVVPRLEEFLSRHPRLGMELFTDDTMSDLVSGDFDAGIRLGHRLAQDVVARPIGGEQTRVVVATPDYLRRHGVPTALEDLAGHECIRFRFPGSGRLESWQFAVDGKPVQTTVEGRLVFADDRLVREATRAGFGLSRQFVASIRDELARGSLVEVLAPYRAPQPGFFVYHHARKLLSPKLRAFLDFYCDAQ